MQPDLTYGILGILAALTSASAWAFGSILFRRLGDEVSPLGMNLAKGIIGILCLGAVILLMGIEPVTAHAFLFLGVSGLLGIALGDTFFFKALIQLGPRLTILLGTLGPVFTVTLAVVFLRERPSLLAWMGIFLVVGGTTWVLWERAPRKKLKAKWAYGVKYALLSALCMSLGIIFAKIGVASCSTLQATLIRFLWSVIGLTLWGCVTKDLGNWLLPFRNPRLLKLIFSTVLVVIFGGFWLFLVALKYIDASIATILNSTTPLFILPMAVFLLKEKISFRAILGAIVAVGGITLIFIG
jgi:drug/metabolite transporter (DMT)-like permease